MLIVKPIHAREGEVVDIHWHTKDGHTVIERRTMPPAVTINAHHDRASLEPDR